MKGIWLFATIPLGLLGGCTGTTGMSGHYVDAAKPASYVDFHADGTIYAHVVSDGFQTQYVSDVAGTYRIEGNTVIVSTPSGAAQKYEIHDTKLVNGSHTLVKQ